MGILPQTVNDSLYRMLNLAVGKISSFGRILDNSFSCHANYLLAHFGINDSLWFVTISQSAKCSHGLLRPLYINRTRIVPDGRGGGMTMTASKLRMSSSL